MLRNWTFGQRLAAAFALAGVTLLLIVAASYQSTQSLIENDARSDHSYQVRSNLARLLATVIDAETGERGFIITGEDSYLAPYNDALTTIPDLFARVQQLTADNPGQQQRWHQLKPLLDTKLAGLDQKIGLRRAQGFDAALQSMADDTGREAMVSIRGVIGAADDEERALLEARNEAAKNSADLVMGVVLWGGLAGVAIVGLVGWFITTSLGRQISTAVGHVQSSAAELQAAANQQSAGIKEQATSMSEITTTISELLATARQIAESAQRVSQIADQTASSAETGDGTVGIAHDSIGAIRRQVDMIVNHMLALGKKSQEIGAVLDIVSELAEQTNILSINATIEAAGAGEAGRRFAIVADEIRKLADRVADSAKEIRTLIDDVRSSVNTTVMATETGSKAVDAGSQQFGEVAVAFKAIAQLVATTTEAAREIELSTKQQSTAVEQVNLAISNVAQAARESEASTGQTLQTATQLADLSQELLRLVQSQRAA
jgi:methyl-accepting chemotaxis protein